MTTREQTIIKALLEYLHSLEGGQATEPQIHADLVLNPTLHQTPPSTAELAAAIKECDAQKLITGISARLTRKIKWNISDLGESVLLEM